MSTSKNRKLLEETSEIMRLRHYSIHTERAYYDWIKQYVRYTTLADTHYVRQKPMP